MKYILFFLGIGLLILNEFFPELIGGVLNVILVISIMVSIVINYIVEKRKNKNT